LGRPNQAGDLHDEPDRLVNARLRKVTRNPGQFPSEQAVLKVLYLAVRNLEDYRGRNIGIRRSGWKQALQAFTIYFEGRIPAL
jgi:putative transposase